MVNSHEKVDMDIENHTNHPNSSLKVVPRMEGTLGSERNIHANDISTANTEASQVQGRLVAKKQAHVGEEMLESAGENTHIGECITIPDAKQDP